MAASLQAMGMVADGRMVRCFTDIDVPPDGLTVLALAEVAGPDVAALVAADATVLVNGRRAAPGSAVRDGDEVSIVVAVGGG